jgi:two-component system LytT family response regulator
MGAQVRAQAAEPLKVLIVDDEHIARVGLRSLLGAHPDVRIIGEAATGVDAATAMRCLEPDVVFLDVQMPDQSGLDLLRGWRSTRRPAVVFVTAHPEYALEAFGHNAVDYLLKPFTTERLAESVRRVVRHLRGPMVGSAGGAPWRDSPPSEGRRVVVRQGDRLHFVEHADVEWLEVFGNYLRVAVGGRFYLLRSTLGELTSKLDATTFVRVSRSVIVNMRHVRSVRWLATGQCDIDMTAGVSLRSSRRYRRDVRMAFAADRTSGAVRP